MRTWLATIVLAAAAVFAPKSKGTKGDTKIDPKAHLLPAPKANGTVVGLCDGQTSLEIRKLAPGESLSRAEAQRVSDTLMAEWRKKNPNVEWDGEGLRLAQNTQPAGTVGPGTATPIPATPKPATPPPAGAPGTQLAHQTGTYANFTTRDEFVWSDETEKFVQEGNRIFHDPKLVGGTIGVSCDMCHPNAANTHPETYPKFQVQLGRVALLRDMINWCIGNPVKGRALTDDDDRLRALEAYVYAQRKGVKLDYGRH